MWLGSTPLLRRYGYDKEEMKEWHCWGSWWRIHEYINYAWFICSLRRFDHQILLKRLEFSFGIKERDLTWVKSYLTDITRCVSVTDKTSPNVGLLFGVPHGFILAPKHYCMCTKPVGEIIKRHNITHHWYNDDTQVYMTSKPCDKWDDISSSIEACIADIITWMNNNMLKLNKDTT